MLTRVRSIFLHPASGVAAGAWDFELVRKCCCMRLQTETVRINAGGESALKVDLGWGGGVGG